MSAPGLQDFGSWLAVQKDRHDPVGHLAADFVERCWCSRCKARPHRATTVEGVWDELFDHHADCLAYAALDQAEAEWRSSIPGPDPDPTPVSVPPNPPQE